MVSTTVKVEKKLTDKSQKNTKKSKKNAKKMEKNGKNLNQKNRKTCSFRIVSFRPQIFRTKYTKMPIFWLIFDIKHENPPMGGRISFCDFRMKIKYINILDI